MVFTSTGLIHVLHLPKSQMREFYKIVTLAFYRSELVNVKRWDGVVMEFYVVYGVFYQNFSMEI